MKPILFNTDMVRAILNGRKTVTRRVIKDKDIINAWDCESYGTPIAFIDHETGDSHQPTFPCQYQPGDILYVRETWARSMAGTYLYKATDTPIILDRWRPLKRVNELRKNGMKDYHLFGSFYFCHDKDARSIANRNFFFRIKEEDDHA